MEEMKQPKKNPWADVERNIAEWQKNDPHGYAKAQLERRVENTVNDLLKEKDGEKLSALSKQTHFCKELLKRQDTTLRDHYDLSSAGIIVKNENAPYTNYLEINMYGSSSAEAVRQAAKDISDKFPEIRFEFTQTSDMIEYVASLKPAAE